MIGSRVSWRQICGWRGIWEFYIQISKQQEESDTGPGLLLEHESPPLVTNFLQQETTPTLTRPHALILSNDVTPNEPVGAVFIQATTVGEAFFSICWYEHKYLEHSWNQCWFRKMTVVDFSPTVYGLSIYGILARFLDRVKYDFSPIEHPSLKSK